MVGATIPARNSIPLGGGGEVEKAVWGVGRGREGGGGKGAGGKGGGGEDGGGEDGGGDG